MSASVPLQAPVIGSLWPESDPKTFLEIQFRTRALVEGFSLAWDDTAPEGVHTFYCFETPTVDGVDSCPCAWTIAHDPKTGVYRTTSSSFTHAHPPVPVESKEHREIVKDQREFLVEAVADLEETATARFDQLRKLSSYRVGLEPLPGPSPSVQQQVIVRDLAVAVGELRARGFELKMRLEDRPVNDYPTVSTFDAPPPPLAPLEPVRRPVSAKAAIASTRPPSLVPIPTSAPSSTPSLVGELPFSRLRTFPPPTRPRSSSTASSRRSPLLFLNWSQFENAVEALASSQGFQVGVREIEVDDDALALGCTEPGCTWRVAVAHASGAERVVVAEKTCYQHKHAEPVRKRRAGEKASSGGSAKGKGLVKADKKKKKSVTFKEPTPPLAPAVAASTPHKRQQMRRKATRAPIVEDEANESDDDADCVFVGKTERDDLKHVASSIPKASAVTAAPSSFKAPAPASSRLALADSHNVHSPASPFGPSRLPIGSVYDPAPFYGSSTASVGPMPSL
ncbi:uncharacterized protein RHOBADRAFT_53087 [Rhodotorula graminis WP1]|uniref:Uncharacterized protein n=1 Tax=Rhodotorula graminis (strain WP1) TaxID=578459 RepID=A0A194S682_RHOGW|nr:uncharacterized protein RHOBADRAFT_53087 [Rhodotorula graminis WP1]KPV76097.1 hypothetical protein RHOBADRAFT_53087 [Rhodotorula graminis WP1]